jgi:hypothetical protein
MTRTEFGAFLWMSAAAVPAQFSDLAASGTELTLPPTRATAAPSQAIATSCSFTIACSGHATGTFAPNPATDCVASGTVGGQDYVSQVDSYSFQGTAGQGIMAVLRTTELSQAILFLLRASDNSVVKVHYRRSGTGAVPLGMVLPETTTYLLQVASFSTPTTSEHYTLDFACETGGQPDLSFHYFPDGWSGPVVVSNVQGSYVDTLSPSTSDTLYLDIAESNMGTAPVSSSYSTDVELDGRMLGTLNNDNLLPGWDVYWSDLPIGSGLAPGPHTLTLRMDTGGSVAETNEDDNTYTKTFTVAGAGQQACTEDSFTLCLDNARYRVRTTWSKTDGSSGQGHAIALTADTGYFWFFNSSNVEAIVKVLEGCGINGHRWVFAGGLTNVLVNLSVTDTVTGTTQTYTNPQGTAFQPIQDTSAFPCN